MRGRQEFSRRSPDANTRKGARRLIAPTTPLLLVARRQFGGHMFAIPDLCRFGSRYGGIERNFKGPCNVTQQPSQRCGSGDSTCRTSFDYGQRGEASADEFVIKPIADVCGGDLRALAPSCRAGAGRFTSERAAGAGAVRGTGARPRRAANL